MARIWSRRAVAAVRDDVNVAVIADGSEAVGFFPFERGGCGVGRPVGGIMSDYHGVVLRPGLRLDGEELIRACDLAEIEREVLFSRRCFKQRGAVYPRVNPTVTADG